MALAEGRGVGYDRAEVNHSVARAAPCRPRTTGLPMPSRPFRRRVGASNDFPPMPEPALALPARIGVFEVLGFLGKGGMGAVYLARQPGLGQSCRTWARHYIEAAQKKE